MKVIIFEENTERHFKQLNIPFTKISFSNENIKKIIQLKELNDEFKITTENLWEKVLNFYNVEEKETLLLQVENYNLAHYLKSTFNNVNMTIVYNETNIEKIFYDMINSDSECEDEKEEKSYIKERHEILSDVDNEKNIIEKILKMNIDNVYCISLKTREDRQKTVIAQCDKLGIALDFIKVDKNKEDPERGCLESHMLCIKDAKENGYKNVLIMEDDILFNGQILRLFLTQGNIKVPENFDMFYLGYNVNNGYKYNDNIMKITSAQCAHSYILNEQVYDYILENIEKDWKTFPEWNTRNDLEKQQNWNCRAVDLFYGKIVNQKRDNSYGLFPILCYQQDSFSDIENKVVSYTKMMNQKSLLMYGNYKHHFNTFFINLDKRQDRLQNFNQKYGKFFSKYQRFGAVDGETYNFTPEILSLFDLTGYPNQIKNPYHSHQFRAGVLGCALSHYSIWEIIMNSQLKDDDFILVLEDDLDFCDDFIVRFNNLLDELVEDKEWDTTFLGFTDYQDKYNDKKVSDSLIRFSGERRLNGGGTFGYLIRKRGARKYIELANKKKIQQAIDWFMIEQFDEVVSYKATPELIFSKVYNPNDKNDSSDVQNKSKQIKAVQKPIEQPKEKEFIEEFDDEDLFDIIEDEIEEDDEDLFDIIEDADEEKPKTIPKTNLLNVSFNEVLIGGNVYFKSESNHLFKMRDDILVYHGVLENNKIIQKCIPRYKFNLNVQHKGTTKEFILFYVDEKIPYSLRKIMESYVVKYNVIVIGKLLYNVIINGVIYIASHTDNLINNVIRQFKISKVFTTNFNVLLYTQKKETQKFYYIHTAIELFPSYDGKSMKNNGVGYIKNMMHNFDSLLFFSQSELDYFKNFLNVKEIQNASLVAYPLLAKQKQDIKKENIIVSYDKHPTQLTEFFKHFNKMMNNTYKLVIFNDDIQNLPAKNIIILPRNEHNFNMTLQKAKLFLTFETLDYTNYNILSAMYNNVLCIIPKYYKELKNKSISFDTITMDTLKIIKDKLDNPKKLNIYKIIHKKVIDNHIKTNKWNEL